MSKVGRIDPRDMTAKEWTAAVTLDLEQFGSVPQQQTVGKLGIHQGGTSVDVPHSRPEGGG